MKRGRHGFSAIELIVIVIAALLLAAILLPAVARLREASQAGGPLGEPRAQVVVEVPWSSIELPQP